MAEKQIKSRIIHKHDIEANWDKATGFIPKQGEIIVYDDRDNDGNIVAPFVRYKIGDGVTVVTELPFAYLNAPIATNSEAGLMSAYDREIMEAFGFYSDGVDGSFAEIYAGDRDMYVESGRLDLAPTDEFTVITKDIDLGTTSGGISLDGDSGVEIFSGNGDIALYGNNGIGLETGVDGIDLAPYNGKVSIYNGEAGSPFALTLGMNMSDRAEIEAYAIDMVSTAESLYLEGCESYINLNNDEALIQSADDSFIRVSSMQGNEWHSESPLILTSGNHEFYMDDGQWGDPSAIEISHNTNDASSAIRMDEKGLQLSSDREVIIDTPNGIQIGKNNNAGCKGYYIQSIDTANKKIYLSETKSKPVFSTGGIKDSAIALNYVAGDKFSIVNGASYDWCGTIKSIQQNIVEYEEDSLGFDSFVEDSGQVDEWCFYVPNKPMDGVVTLKGKALSIGELSKASGDRSFAQGKEALAAGDNSSAMGTSTKAINYSSHAEGRGTIAQGDCAHAEGDYTQALAKAAHSEGYRTIASGKHSHAEGEEAQALGDYSHAEGYSTEAIGLGAHAEGLYAQAINDHAHAEGYQTAASGDHSHAEGESTVASGKAAHSEGLSSLASQEAAHAEGVSTIADNQGAHAEGYSTEALGQFSHAEGNNTKAYAPQSHAEGGSTIAGSSDGSVDGTNAHAEGQATIALARASHAEGNSTQATGIASHAEGFNTLASGGYSHAEGKGTKATNWQSHAGGENSEANGLWSFAHGRGVKADKSAQTAFGQYNAADDEALFIIGNGTSDSKRSNAFQVDKKGNVQFAGSIDTMPVLDGSDGNSTGNKVYIDTDGNPVLDWNIADYQYMLDEIVAMGGSFSNPIPIGSIGYCAQTIGGKSSAQGRRSRAEGTSAIAVGDYSHADGNTVIAYGDNSIAQGMTTLALGEYSHAKGRNTIAAGKASYAEGSNYPESGEGTTQLDPKSLYWDGTTYIIRGPRAEGVSSHAEGVRTFAYGYGSHAEGVDTEATGRYGSHAEGYGARAEGQQGAHAEGKRTHAVGLAAHAEGESTIARGNSSHAGGKGTIANVEAQTAIGKYNADNNNALFIVGCGTSGSDRSNAFTVDTSGNGWFAGNLTLNDTTLTEDYLKLLLSIWSVNYDAYNNTSPIRLGTTEDIQIYTDYKDITITRDGDDTLKLSGDGNYWRSGGNLSLYSSTMAILAAPSAWLDVSDGEFYVTVGSSGNTELTMTPDEAYLYSERNIKLESPTITFSSMADEITIDTEFIALLGNLGDIDTALDSIISIQESLMGVSE